MKVSYHWLSEYVDLSGYSARELADKLTRSGVEVDAVEQLDKGVTNVVVGLVKSRERHPDADKLSVCVVDAGTGEDLQIVCGAKNVAAGQKVPVALIGAKLPGGLHIKKAKLRGVESHGMICSAKELGLNDKLLPKEIQEGILVLPNDVTIGADIHDVLGLSDEVLELDLTPNRSDCLSMIGVAYEIAAIIDCDVRLPDEQAGLGETGKKASDLFSVSISAPEQCPGYTARYLENVKIGPSPLWMQNRLMAAGIRPINNIVDITNYVMLEYGQPLHAFDAHKLAAGRIDVRLAKAGEEIVTLDNATRKLEPHMLVIADGEKPIAVAGVMGGANSEVTSETTAILLESAHFAGSSVRKTSRELGLRSEASLRFEKEINPDFVIPALNRAASLMAQYAGATAANGVVAAGTLEKQPAVVELSLTKVNNYLGTQLSGKEVAAIFRRLHFAFAETEDSLYRVQVPNRRGDISLDVDLIEEIARLHGYDEIPLTLMSGVTTPGTLTKAQTVRRSLRKLLTDQGLCEAVNYSVTHPGNAERFPGLYPDAVPIALFMPMSEDRSVLRTSLIPQLLEQAAYNRNRGAQDIAMFEIGNVFLAKEKRISALPQEKTLLGMLLAGGRSSAHWAGKQEPVDFYDLKGIIENLLAFLGITDAEFMPAAPTGMHPGRTAEVHGKRADGKSVRLGMLGQLHPELAEKYDLKDTFVAELELHPLYALTSSAVMYRALPRYPAVSRDIAVVVEAKTAAKDLLAAVKSAAGAQLESAEVFDVYAGERLGAGRKSIALSLVFRHPERTLTDEEISDMMQKIIASLEQTFHAQLRS
ncbi:MAG TPA: phenylalanine--tRNA ligase subunit beta [Bacilli bacterium]